MITKIYPTKTILITVYRTVSLYRITQLGFLLSSSDVSPHHGWEVGLPIWTVFERWSEEKWGEETKALWFGRNDRPAQKLSSVGSPSLLADIGAMLFFRKVHCLIMQGGRTCQTCPGSHLVLMRSVNF